MVLSVCFGDVVDLDGVDRVLVGRVFFDFEGLNFCILFIVRVVCA